jgi:hypothetical protein
MALQARRQRRGGPHLAQVEQQAVVPQQAGEIALAELAVAVVGNRPDGTVEAPGRLQVGQQVEAAQRPGFRRVAIAEADDRNPGGPEGGSLAPFPASRTCARRPPRLPNSHRLAVPQAITILPRPVSALRRRALPIGQEQPPTGPADQRRALSKRQPAPVLAINIQLSQ